MISTHYPLLAMYDGMQVLVSDHATETVQMRFSRRKKKRIRKKMAKKYRITRPCAYVSHAGTALIVHPIIAAEMKEMHDDLSDYHGRRARR